MYDYYLAIQKLIILLIVVVLLSAAEAQLHKSPIGSEQTGEKG